MSIKLIFPDKFKMAKLSDLWIGQKYWVYTILSNKLTKHIVRRRLKKEKVEEYKNYKDFLKVIIKEKRCYILK